MAVCPFVICLLDIGLSVLLLLDIGLSVLLLGIGLSVLLLFMYYAYSLGIFKLFLLYTTKLALTHGPHIDSATQCCHYPSKTPPLITCDILGSIT